MNPQEQHPDLGNEATARAAQLAAMLVSVAEAAARLRAHRQAAAATAAARDAGTARALQHTQSAAARVVYGAALDQPWLRQASTSDLLGSWHAAGPYLHTDPTASLAADRVEDRLRQLHPEAMAAYDATRAAGFPREDCLDAASLLWRGEYGLDPIGTPVARAAGDLAADSPVTGVVPDAVTQARTTTGARAAGPVGGLASLHDQHRVVMGQTFPVDIHTAMRTAPAAAKARLAITAAPQRRQLTATPHLPRSTR